MNEEKGTIKEFVGYEYQSITVTPAMESVYTDGYENFGWIREEASVLQMGKEAVYLKFKSDRKIRNKAELTRLQRQFEACVGEMISLEKAKNANAMITAFTIGILGCAFLGGATFAYLAGMLPLMIILAVPGFIGWILPYFCYHSILAKRSARNAPLIDKIHDEIYDVCEKANHLLA